MLYYLLGKRKIKEVEYEIKKQIENKLKIKNKVKKKMVKAYTQVQGSLIRFHLFIIIKRKLKRIGTKKNGNFYWMRIKHMLLYLPIFLLPTHHCFILFLLLLLLKYTVIKIAIYHQLRCWINLCSRKCLPERFTD